MENKTHFNLGDELLERRRRIKKQTGGTLNSDDLKQLQEKATFNLNYRYGKYSLADNLKQTCLNTLLAQSLKRNWIKLQ